MFALYYLSAECGLHSLRVRRDGMQGYGCIQRDAGHDLLQLSYGGFDGDSRGLTAALHGSIPGSYIIGENIWWRAGHAFNEECKVVSCVAKMFA